jgi:hypothetical protein
MTPPAWIVACEAELACGFDPHVLSYRRAWESAVEACAKTIEADMCPSPTNDYQRNYNADLASVAQKLRNLK